MCIIAAKPAGIPMPDKTTRKRMWDNNSDGAGFMYSLDGAVYIEKGFMKFSEMENALENLAARADLKALPLVMHYRITTHGGTKPENCHPFPLTCDPKIISRTKTKTHLGIAHNGIIPSVSPRKGMSDTMEYILTQLHPISRICPRFYENKDAVKLISNAIDSKMAFLTKDGGVYTIGKFEMDNGVLYSNTTYRYDRYMYRYSDYDYDRFYNYGGWYEGGTYSGKSTSKSPAKTSTKSSTDEFLASINAKYFMWLDEGYVIDDNGEYHEGEDCMIDDTGVVYEYDYDLSCAVRRASWSPYSNTGVHPVFDYDAALPEAYVDTDEDYDRYLGIMLFGED